MSDLSFAVYALEVTSIALNAWLIGIHLHEDAGLGRIERSADLGVVTCGVEAEVVVDTATSILYLIEVSADGLADGSRLTEVEYGTLDWLDLAGWDVEGIRWGEVVGIEHEQHVGAWLVEVAVEVVVVVVGSNADRHDLV